jgi:hypothetical protein
MASCHVGRTRYFEKEQSLGVSNSPNYLETKCRSGRLKYKGKTCARGYIHIYDINYVDIFPLVAQMNTRRILVSYATNFGWSFYQLDVKNAFLHGDQ